MKIRDLNAGVSAELDLLAAQNVLDFKQAEKLKERYPSTTWDLLTLVRWLLLPGVVSMGIGAVILIMEFVTVLRLIETSLLLALVALPFLARWLDREKNMPRLAAVCELAAGFALQGLTLALAKDFSTGSKNWPALIGLDAALLTAFAYFLKNRLVLIHAVTNVFFYFGAATGYISGWGMYWLGMDYPLRYVLAGAVSVGIGFLHLRFVSLWQNFSRVYLHFGLFSMHLALWFFALFGYFNGEFTWSENSGQRLLFSVVWAIFSLAGIFGAARIGQYVFRAYGMVFLTINLYTFYFQFVAANTVELWFLHMLLIGASLIFAGIFLERKLRKERNTAQESTEQPADRAMNS